MRRRVMLWIGVGTIVAVAGIVVAKERYPDATSIAWESMLRRVHGGYTVEGRITQFGEAARARLRPFFDSAGVAYPPSETAWIAFKDRRVLEVWARSPRWRRIREYPILGASGRVGPKLKEGDLQVPEGIYRVVLLNPNSLYHVSMRLDYPNAFDRRMALADGRTDLGGDIMIHGKTCSVGCLAMGDEAAEDLFTLAYEAGTEHVTVIIAPADLRSAAGGASLPRSPAWVRDLYREIAGRLAEFPR